MLHMYLAVYIKWVLVSFIKFFYFIYFGTDWLREIVNEHEKTFDPENLRDFIDAFIAEKRKGTDKTFEVSIQSVKNLH